MRVMAGAFGYNERGIWCTAGGGYRATHRLYAAHRTYPSTWPWVRKVYWRGYWCYGGIWPYDERVEALRLERSKPRASKHRLLDGRIQYFWRQKSRKCRAKELK
jgi:hypothetical protein